MKNIIIVDDSRLFRKVMESILAPYFKIVATGACGLEGFDLYKELKPNVVLMDITMPNCNGKECLKKIIEFDPLAKVIMVSSIGDEQTVKECLDLGAKAFIKKEEISKNDSNNSALVKTTLQVAS